MNRKRTTWIEAKKSKRVEGRVKLIRHKYEYSETGKGVHKEYHMRSINNLPTRKYTNTKTGVTSQKIVGFHTKTYGKFLRDLMLVKEAKKNIRNGINVFDIKTHLANGSWVERPIINSKTKKPSHWGIFDLAGNLIYAYNEVGDISEVK